MCSVRVLFMLLTVVVLFSPVLVAQRPVFADAALVSPGPSFPPKPYLILVYGGVGCGYSQLLIKNLHRFQNCPEAEVILLMDQSPTVIQREMPSVADSFKTYSNAVLNHRFRKHNDIFPQVFVFRGPEQVLHLMGLKKGLISRVRRVVECGEETE